MSKAEVVALTARVRQLETENQQMLEELQTTCYPEMDRMRVALTEILKIPITPDTADEASRVIALFAKTGLGNKVQG